MSGARRSWPGLAWPGPEPRVVPPGHTPSLHATPYAAGALVKLTPSSQLSVHNSDCQIVSQLAASESSAGFRAPRQVFLSHSATVILYILTSTRTVHPP
jgi:hypothetical protein